MVGELSGNNGRSIRQLSHPARSTDASRADECALRKCSASGRTVVRTRRGEARLLSGTDMSSGTQQRRSPTGCIRRDGEL